MADEPSWVGKPTEITNLDEMGPVVPVPHPHYCVHGQQIGWHLAIDPDTVIDHKFCTPCRKCEQGIPPERTSALGPFTDGELVQLAAALNQRCERLVETMRDPVGVTGQRMDMLTVTRSLLQQVRDALGLAGVRDE